MQRKLVSLITMVFLGAGLYAQGKVMIFIDNIRNNNGVCRVCMFNTAASFSGGGQPYSCRSVIIANKSAQAVFTGVAAGLYAVLVFHDVNNNNKFDKNFLGIPKEGYGASKNNLPFAAAPAFKENSFPVKNGTEVTLHIKLRNLL